MQSMPSPTPAEAAAFLTDAYGTCSIRPVVVIVGRCTVEYSGRAKSFLGYGERVVVIKPDGVVLVHRVGGTDPINWQPPGTSIRWWAEEEMFIEAVHHKQQERMLLGFQNISLVFAQSLQDGGEFSIVGMEKDLVEAIVENPSLLEDGMVFVQREQRTKSGAMDIVCRDKDGVGVIVEVKRSSAGPSAASQLIAYVSDFRRNNPDLNIRGILVAPKIQPTAKTTLELQGLEYRELEAPRTELSRNQTTMDKFF